VRWEKENSLFVVKRMKRFNHPNRNVSMQISFDKKGIPLRGGLKDNINFLHRRYSFVAVRPFQIERHTSAREERYELAPRGIGVIELMPSAIM
jgi:hypothetical protein